MAREQLKENIFFSNPKKKKLREQSKYLSSFPIFEVDICLDWLNESLDFIRTDMSCRMWKDQPSISSTFYVQIFGTNDVSAAFSSYVLALSKNLYEKCAHMTLMKFTIGRSSGLNSISSSFCARVFLYESALCSFSLVTFWLCNFLAQKYWRKRHL